jgi:hypothetical protein
MTLKQISEDAGCSYRTVKSTAKRLWPDSDFKERGPSDAETDKLMRALPKRNIVEGNPAPAKGNSAPSIDRIERLETLMAAQIGMVEHLCKALAAIPGAIAGQRLALPDIEQDYFTIKGWAARMGEKITYSEAIALGKSAKRLSVERDIEVRKADDEKYGYVGSYHRSILEDAFRA